MTQYLVQELHGRSLQEQRQGRSLTLATLCLYRYRMDYMKFVEHHRSTNADITIGCLPVDYERASDFGLMKIDDEGRIFVSALLAALGG